MREDDAGFTHLTAVAIDWNKNSQQAVKWAIDHILGDNPLIVLVHVSTTTPHGTKEAHGRNDAYAVRVTNLFRSFRLYCARKGLRTREVVLEGVDVSKALIDYINSNHIMNMVVGSSNRNALARLFRNPDVPTRLMKSAPDFCTLYVIWKGKATSVRTPKTQDPGPTEKSTVPAPPPVVNRVEQDDRLSNRSVRGGRKLPTSVSTTPERRSVDGNAEYVKTSPRDRSVGEILEAPTRLSRSRASPDSFMDDMDLQGGMSFLNAAIFDSQEYSSAVMIDSRGNSTASSTCRDLESELKRMKLELKQTMDMYSNACKEAVSAKQKADELRQWKMAETRRMEEARQAEEAALEIAEIEKARSKAAIEAAQAAQRIAELEAKKRLNAEHAARREAEEKKRALDVLARKDVRYRRYSIDEIEVATDHFADASKIGEGGYGPVYRATLGHTPVAVKALRPDAAQGRQQFQQEVEVLCCMRHPHLVLLLGACPEYGCLVYEYMDNGSLEDRLLQRGNTPPIPWSIRFKIAAEVATGLLFLHQAKPEPLVHRDLKPANILLDRNYISKIADVGLARLVPSSVADTVTQYRMTSAAGTFCYIDPEYQQTGMLGMKSDVYSFGIMLLQIITAKPPMGLAHQVRGAVEQGTLKEILDPTIMDWPMEETLSFAKLALQCSELRRKDRPDLATEILPVLLRLRELGDEWDSGNLRSRSETTTTSHSKANTCG